MKLVDVTDWATRPDFATPQGAYCGIAIGPESDVGIVRVGRARLQAGRWLPVAAASYQITRDRVPVTTGHDETITGLPELARLQLLLAECPSELAINPARPNGRYSATWQSQTGIVFRALDVPMEGRRCMRLALSGASMASLQVTIYGRYVRPSDGTVREVQLSQTGSMVAGTDYYSVTGTSSLPAAWEALGISVKDTGAGQALALDVETIGEEVGGP